VCIYQLQPPTTVRNHGVYVDSDLSMRSYVLWTVVGCFAALLLIEVFGGLCHPLRWRPWSCHWYWLGLTMVMQHWLASRRTCCVSVQAVLNASARTIPVFHSRRTSPRRSLDCTGYVRLSALSSSWQRWLTIACTVQPPRYLSAQLNCVADIPSLPSTDEDFCRSLISQDFIMVIVLNLLPFHCWLSCYYWGGYYVEVKAHGP